MKLQYRELPEYRDDPSLREDGIISYITSAGYVVEYWFTYVQSCIRRMAEGDESANFLAFDYLITQHHNIKTEEMLKNEMEETDPAIVEMEYLNLPAGGSGRSFYKVPMFKRNMKKAFYPIDDTEFNPNKRFKNSLEKTDGEFRFVGIDVSTRANKMNDLTIVGAVRAIPKIGVGFERHLSYIECFKLKHTGDQASRVKKVFFDFIGCTTQEDVDRWKDNPTEDYIVLDVQNAGINYLSSLSVTIR